MILGKDTNPSKHIYFLGAKVLGILKDEDKKEINFLDTFHKLNTEEKVSMNLFTLTLDWLYLIGVVKKNTKGQLEKCF